VIGNYQMMKQCEREEEVNSRYEVIHWQENITNEAIKSKWVHQVINGDRQNKEIVTLRQHC